MAKSPEDLIRAFYAKVERRAMRPPLLLSVPFTLTNSAGGLGDSVILTDFIHRTKGTWPVWSHSSAFHELRTFLPYPHVSLTPFHLNAPAAIDEYESGNGHFIQRIQRIFGLVVDPLPKGYLDFSAKKQKHITLHFSPGRHADMQRRTIHARARVLYPETTAVLERFIAESDYIFYILGDSPNITGAENIPHPSITQMVHLIASASYHIGIMSGPLHIAAALNIPTMAIINFPAAEKIYLPTLKPMGQVEEEWFYPQNVHLHQEPSTNPLVPQITLKTLCKAIDGYIYPFWRKEHLNLIYT
jgi:hypothetical protein